MLILSHDSASEKWIQKEQLPYFSISKPRKYFSFKQFYELTHVLKEQSVDHIFLSSSQDLDLACWAKTINPKIRSLKIVFYQQMQLGVVKKNIYQNWKLNLIYKWISPLPWLKDEVLTKSNLDKNKVEVIPLCIDTEEFLRQLSLTNKNNFFKKYDIPQDTFLFGIVGRIDPGKGQLTVVKSFAKLLGNMSNPPMIKLFIVGSTTINDEAAKLYEEELVQTINTLNLSKYIIRISHLHQPTEIYAALDCLIVASLKETFGMVTVEGLLAKLVVIGANSGGTIDLLEHGKLGLLYDPHNENDLHLKMQEVLSNYSMYKNKIDPMAIAKQYDFKRLENFLLTHS